MKRIAAFMFVGWLFIVALAVAGSAPVPPATDPSQIVFAFPKIQDILQPAQWAGIFAGLIPYLTGYYSSDPFSVVLAIIASLAGVLIDHGTLKTIQQALTRALENQPGISAAEIIRQ